MLGPAVTQSPAPLPQRPSRPVRDVGDPLATTTVDGIKVEVWMRDTTIESGDWLNLLLRVTNTNDGPVYLGGCGDLGQADVDIEPLFDLGRSWDGVFGDFKRQLLAESWVFPSYFVPFKGRAHSCEQDIPERVGAGERHDFELVRQTGWLPWRHLQRRPLPPGDVIVRAGTELRDGPEGRSSRSIAVEFRVRLVGEGQTYPSPGELVDVALGHAPFAEWLARQPRSDRMDTHWGTWPNEDGTYPSMPAYARATDGAVDIGLFAETGSPWVAMVIIDPWTGEVLGTRFE